MLCAVGQQMRKWCHDPCFLAAFQKLPHWFAEADDDTEAEDHVYV
jgi:hypothetical protein